MRASIHFHIKSQGCQLMKNCWMFHKLHIMPVLNKYRKNIYVYICKAWR